MPRIQRSALQTGMQVDTEVRNADGMLILPAGCELTERHLDILESWGIEEIEVKIPDGMDNPSDPLARLDPETLARLTAEARARFFQFDEADAIAQEILAIVLRRLARRQPAAPRQTV